MTMNSEDPHERGIAGLDRMYPSRLAKPNKKTNNEQVRDEIRYIVLSESHRGDWMNDLIAIVEREKVAFAVEQIDDLLKQLQREWESRSFKGIWETEDFSLALVTLRSMYRDPLIDQAIAALQAAT